MDIQTPKINLLNRIREKEEENVFNDIRNLLVSLNTSQTSIADILKQQQKEVIREKVEDRREDERDIIENEAEETDTEKEIGALRKAFQQSFGSIKDVFSPGGLIKSFGLFSGSPLFMLLGDKFDDLLSSYSDFRKENNKNNEKLITNQERATQDDFMKEQQRDEELNIFKTQVGLLEEIRDKEFTTTDDKKGLLDFAKGPLAFLSKMLPKRFVKLFGGLLGGGLGGLGGGKLLKSGGKLLKGGGRLLGKLALPLALVSGGFDFASGFKNASEITGREDFSGKVQAGISEVISGFTFGLLDSKLISKGIDALTDRLKDIFNTPLELIRDIANGEDIIKSVSKYISKSTFGIITPKTIEKGIESLKNKLMDMFFAPLELIKDIAGGKNIITALSEAYTKFTFGIIPSEIIEEGLTLLKDRVISIFKNSLNILKEKSIEYGTKLIETLKESISHISFGLLTPEKIDEGISLLTEKIHDIFFGSLENFNSTFDGIKNEIGRFKAAIKDKVESITNLLKEPLETVKSFMNNITSSIGLDPIFDKPMDDKEDDGRLFSAQKSNPVLDTIEKTEVRRKIVQEERLKKDRERAREREERINNNFVNSIQNNLVVQEDMNVRTGDREWLYSSRY